MFLKAQRYGDELYRFFLLALMDNTTNDVSIALLRSALWKDMEALGEEVRAEMDWKEIAGFFTKQSLDGLLPDAIASLPTATYGGEDAAHRTTATGGAHEPRDEQRTAGVYHRTESSLHTLYITQRTGSRISVS